MSYPLRILLHWRRNHGAFFSPLTSRLVEYPIDKGFVRFDSYDRVKRTFTIAVDRCLYSLLSDPSFAGEIEIVENAEYVDILLRVDDEVSHMILEIRYGEALYRCRHVGDR